MKIRAITLFTPLNWPFDMASIVSAGRFLRFAKKQLEKAGYIVQTLRLATPPFMDLLGDPTPSALEEFVVKLEQHTRQQEIDFVSIGPVVATTPLSHLSPIQAIPNLIAKTQTIFAAVQTASPKTGVNLAAIQAAAQAIHQIGQITPNGFGNLRFAMLANVAPRGPFFPGAYHNGVNPAFGLAMEAANLAVGALQNAQTLEQAQERLIAAFNEHGARLQNIIDLLVDEHSVHFSGIDFSLAPYPESATSVGAAMEHLGVDAFGAHGTLFATAFLTNCIKQADIPHAGYSGVMLPVLEDNILARRSLDHNYTINDLLLYSAVCGTGLDTIPIPGDTSPEQIAGLLLDVATLAVLLNKPLSARLMPVPGLKAGDMTDFDFEYFANSAVLPLKSKAASAIFAKNSFYSF